ncbi:MAG: response regulator [Gammaproteobacteria bacterium]|nr:response regulator [Gammaproteobacteria bacterium]
MAQPTYILYADDEPLNQAIMEDLFSDHPEFELGLADDGDHCLQMVAERAPDLILMDVNMPNRDGYSACAQLRANLATAKIPLIFVSALTSPEDRMAGYKAGGDDYITKPFDGEEVLFKINQQLSDRHELLQSQQHLNKTEKYSRHLNYVLDFVRQSFGCRGLDDLCDTAFVCLRNFELEGSILVNCFDEPLTFFSDGRERPLEQEILLKLNAKGGVLSFGHRYSLSIPGFASLLVRNLPEDRVKAEQLADHLALLLDALAARLTELREQREAVRAKMEASAVIQAAHTTLDNLNLQRAEQLYQSRQIMLDLEDSVDQLFLGLGLTESQELAIKQLVGDSSQRLEQLYQQEEQIETQFRQVMALLLSSTGNQSS